ncbi:putative nuclease HARBI1 isoform X2 [Bacillus rossius redtenbacheri]|uniref:putative nuclease HARBI1 isoform X2 n=1 Tax=Bacillus rossius redtenbacheri TaxID=93214 RepID=UPI002FDD3FE7
MARAAYNVIFEEDSDGDDFIPLRRPRTIRERSNYFESYDEVEFRTHFRLSKQSAHRLLEMIEAHLEYPSDRNMSVSPMQQLLATLRYYATGCHQLSTGDYAGFSKSTAHRIIHKVSCAVASLRPNFIHFPETPQEVHIAQMDFYNIARFPKVIGAMDCTHVRLQSPGGDNAEMFRNRKGYFSLNVQAICDAKLQFTDIVARWPGSTHDSTIFSNCYRRAMFENGRYNDCVLLVDSGYACKSYMMTPLESPDRPQEHLYNESQIRTRNPVERLFGCWKRRFPVLALGFQIQLENTFPIIVATAVIHNLLRQAGEELPPDDPDVNLPKPWDELLEEGNDEQNVNNNARHARNDAKRRTLIDNYFRSLL